MSQTPPDKLVLRLLYPRDISTPAIEWGIEHEKVALDAENLTVCPYGFLVCQNHPFLGCSPDGGVYDPISYTMPRDQVPLSYRDATVHEASKDPKFCSKEIGSTVTLCYNTTTFAKYKARWLLQNDHGAT